MRYRLTTIAGTLRMVVVREWQLTAGDPLAMRVAADVRLSKTDYSDDQSWEAAFGGVDEPALAFQTRYGGRVGLARLVPMWAFEGRTVYERQAFISPPTLTAFAPNYLRIASRPTQELSTWFDLWAMDSHVIGGRLALRNESNAPLTLSFHLVAQVAREGKVIDLEIVRVSGGTGQSTDALHLGAVGNIHPAVLLENASGSNGAHLIAPLTIQPSETQTLRWVHAGLPTLAESLRTAQAWLYRTDWDAAISAIDQLAARLPTIETGNNDLDAALAFGATVTLRNFLGATGKLPYPSLVNARIPPIGFGPAPEWQGQDRK